MIVGYGRSDCRFSADAMTEFSLIASFSLYLDFVSVYQCLSMVWEVALPLLS